MAPGIDYKLKGAAFIHWLSRLEIAASNLNDRRPSWLVNILTVANFQAT